jgi:hypothetical protein
MANLPGKGLIPGATTLTLAWMMQRLSVGTRGSSAANAVCLKQ